MWRGGQQPLGPQVQGMMRVRSGMRKVRSKDLARPLPRRPPWHPGPGGQMRAGKQFGLQPPQQQGNKDENGPEVGTN